LLALNGRRVTDKHSVDDERAVAARIWNGEVEARVKRADTAPDDPGEDTAESCSSKQIDSTLRPKPGLGHLAI
jgi:hypothetical protein